MGYTNTFDPRKFSDKDIAPTGSDEKKLKGSDFSDGANGDFDLIKKEFVKIETAIASIGTTRDVFASCTYPGGSGPVDPAASNNVASVDWVLQTSEAPEDGGDDWRFAKVRFATPIPGGSGLYPGNPNNGALDVNVNIQVTAFSQSSPPNSLGQAGFVSAVVTNIDKDGCEIAFFQTDGAGAQNVVWYTAFCLLVAEN